MAAKRITASVVNWVDLASRVPPNQMHLFTDFKSRADGYLKKVLENPENPPAIDWSTYKSKINVPGLVDEFQKEYTALQVPYPTETVSGDLDKYEQVVKTDISSYKQESDARIAEYKKGLAFLATLIPFDQMTMDDFRDCYPELAVDCFKKPTFWPHKDDDQIGYVEPEKGGH